MLCKQFLYTQKNVFLQGRKYFAHKGLRKEQEKDTINMILSFNILKYGNSKRIYTSQL